MRFFKEIKASIKADNSSDPDVALIKKFDRASLREWKRYYGYLDKIAERLGPKAYKFFRFGFAETGLHDAFLLNCCFGDAIDGSNPNFTRLRFGRVRSVFEMKMLTYSKERLHRFTFKGLRKVIVDIPSEEPIWFEKGKIGQIYSYEVVAVLTE